ncbi:hypothetical protein CathTA2_1456 [Caldalkalibacillus thermarum TA2.A1]|uniref:Uncharacterized protein n=1 Tax=Caldalkalibacillus thermarum (strain TA2.A1) TaxID=986075 RepID=F5L6K6_CALTT|nr:hypothetical protein CathTA2_1456 [Caldalkalibacillus thermarum TA2.A1]
MEELGMAMIILLAIILTFGITLWAGKRNSKPDSQDDEA